MAKNKVKQEYPNNDYFYEVVGVTLIILSIITLGELGSFGSMIFLLLRLFIGDYAFLLVGLMLILGFKALIKKEFIDISTLSFQGLVLLLLALSLLSHFAIFNALEMSPREVLTTTIKLYRSYLSGFQSHYITGGGIVGALMFQGIIIILGEVGIYLIAIALFVLGTSFLFNTKLIGLLSGGGNFTPIIKKALFSIRTYFKNLHYKEKVVKKQDINIKPALLKDITNTNLKLQKEIAQEVGTNLTEYINHNDLFCKYVSHEVSYAYTRYIIEYSSNANYKEIREKMNIFFNNKCLFIKTNEYKIYIDVYNIFKDLLTLKRLLLKENEDSIVLGLDITNNLVNLNPLDDTCLIMIGDTDSGIKNSIKCLMINTFIKYQRNVGILFYDVKKEFMELSNISDQISYHSNINDGNYMFDDLIKEYDRRKDILNYLNTDNYVESNKEIKTSYPNIKIIKPIYVFINTDLLKTNLDFDAKIDYLLKFSYKVGIFFTVIVRKKEELIKLRISNNVYMGFYTSDLDLSLKILGNENLCCLNKMGDFMYIKKNEAWHCQAPYISNTDYLNIIKRVI